MKKMNHTQTRTDITDTHKRAPMVKLNVPVCVCACLCVAIFFMYFSICFPAAAAEILTGKLSDVAGEVEVQKRGSAEWTRATSGMTVSPGDQINTGLNGRARLLFKNSVTEIMPLTQFVVGRAFEDDKNVNTELFLQIGKVVSNVDPRSEKKNKFTVTTPTAVAGIRGTRQECGFSKGFGTEVKIRDGAGYMAPVKAEKLPLAVQAMLGVAPAGGGRAGGVGRGEGKAEAPKTVKEAVAEFNAWLQQSEQSLSGGAAGEGVAQPLLDPKTLDYVISVGDGLSATIQNASDPKSIVDPVTALIQNVAPSVLPAGSAPSEDKATLTSTEIVDAPVTVTIIQEAAIVQQAVTVQATTTSTTVTPTPPNRPTTSQGQGVQP